VTDHVTRADLFVCGIAVLGLLITLLSAGHLWWPGVLIGLVVIGGAVSFTCWVVNRD
jgi:hypothetical protein